MTRVRSGCIRACLGEVCFHNTVVSTLVHVLVLDKVYEELDAGLCTLIGNTGVLDIIEAVSRLLECIAAVCGNQSIAVVRGGVVPEQSTCALLLKGLIELDEVFPVLRSLRNEPASCCR